MRLRSKALSKQDVGVVRRKIMRQVKRLSQRLIQTIPYHPATHTIERFIASALSHRFCLEIETVVNAIHNFFICGDKPFRSQPVKHCSIVMRRRNTFIENLRKLSDAKFTHFFIGSHATLLRFEKRAPVNTSHIVLSKNENVNQ